MDTKQQQPHKFHILHVTSVTAVSSGRERGMEGGREGGWGVERANREVQCREGESGEGGLGRERGREAGREG